MPRSKSTKNPRTPAKPKITPSSPPKEVVVSTATKLPRMTEQEMVKLHDDQVVYVARLKYKYRLFIEAAGILLLLSMIGMQLYEMMTAGMRGSTGDNWISFFLRIFGVMFITLTAQKAVLSFT